MTETHITSTTERMQRRLTDSQPVLNMLFMLSEAGRVHFHDKSAWEVCLCALMLAMEPNCKLEKILAALPYTSKPLDEADMLNTMAHLGYVAHKATTTLDEVDDRLLPALFVPQEGDPSIILSRNEKGQLRFYDPLSKIISMVPPFFDENGVIWFFQPYDEHKQPTSKFMRKGSGYSWFRALLGRFKGTFAQILTAGLILNIIALITPLFIMLVYDKVIAAGVVETLPMLALGAVIAIFFEWRLRNIRSRGLSWLAGRLDNIVGNKIFAHLIGLSPTLIEKASVAAQIARIKTFESVRDFFSGSVFLSLLEAPFVLLAIAAVALIGGTLVFVPLTIALGYAVIFMLARQKIKVSIRLAAKASSARQQFTIETFEKLHGIRSQGLSAKWQEKFRHLSGREMMAHFELSWLGMVAESTAHALTVLAAVATVGFGVQMIWDGSMTTGALVASMILVWRILTPFYSLCTMVPRLEQLRNSIMQVNQLIDIDTEAEEARSFSRLPRVRGAIAFQHVYFRYTPDNDDVLRDLTFEAAAGQMVVITGRNGTGKASMLKLVQALHQPAAGSIMVDGFDIRQLDAPDLRRQIAYVPKTAHMFSGTILENLRFANPVASEEEVINALKLADAWEEVERLPDGLHYQVNVQATHSLTSSLKTRLTLARAYLHQGNILLIDDLPNTLLSAQTGRNLYDYIKEMKGRRTILMCSYREDFMELADKVILLRAGEKANVTEMPNIMQSVERGEAWKQLAG